MRLLRLVLQGFKSFADRTEISFPEGITMIVGPNGCGKSNISDAVRWVLGEQNIRNLRGQKAEDIIFSGSAARKAKNGAEVTMVLDNAARDLSLDTAEVSVTRRILRNGDSDFLINGRACRLKDIQELFANTGLGKGSLAIIGQNRVDQVLSARPEERRLIFEEVAGISRYRMRKEEGMGKLRRTADNMERVKDLMAVLEEQLRPMEAAAEKARSFQTLMKEKQAVEATVSLLKLTSVRRMLGRYETEHRDLTDEKLALAAKLSSLDAELSGIEEEEAAGDRAFQQAAERVAGMQQALERIHGDWRVKEANRTHEEEEIRRLTDWLSAQAKEEETTRAGEAALTGEAEQAKAAWEAQKSALGEAEGRKTEAGRALTRAEAQYDEAAQEIRRRQSRRQAIGEALRRKSEAAARLAEAAGRAKEEEDRQRAEVQRLVQLLKAGADESQARARKMEEVTAEGKAQGAALKAGEAESLRLLNAWNEARSEAAQCRSHRAYLERAEKEKASFSSTTRTILRAEAPWRRHIIGALGDLLRVPAAYTEAAEAALGGTISYIVTDTAQAAQEIIQWMKKVHAGRTTFYPLDVMKPRYGTGAERQAAGEPGIIGIAADLFECDPAISDLKQALLGRILIAEDLDAARQAAKKYGQRLHIVTLDGQIIRPGGAMTGGSLRKRENTFFGRKKEIAALLAREEAAARQAEAGKREREAREAENARLSQAVEKARDAWQALRTESAAASVRQEGLEAARQAAEAAMKKAAEEAARLEEEKEKNGREEEALRREEEALGNVPEMPEDTALSAARQAAARAGEAVTACLLAAARGEAAFRRASERLAEQEARLAEGRRAREAAEEELARHQKEAAQIRAALTGLDEDFQKQNTALAEAKAQQEERKNDRDGLAIRRSTADAARREAQRAASVLEGKLAERQVRMDGEKQKEREALARLQTAGLTEASAESLRLPGNAQDMAGKLASLTGKIDSLGPVNPNAEAEYQLEKERYHSYEVQLEDLQKARDGLETVIRGIDEAMAAQFTEAFAKVNEEFGRIMHLMFQGGSGRLELTDPGKPLECGVELYLDLPGKKRQPLSLMSGGERALTVIALLISFLAYRPAPFCFVDEIDAALDDANVERFAAMVAEYKKRAQFIVITHRKKTMEFGDTLQGVTMGEKGVSTLVTVHVEDCIKEA